MTTADLTAQARKFWKERPEGMEVEEAIATFAAEYAREQANLLRDAYSHAATVAADRDTWRQKAEALERETAKKFALYEESDRRLNRTNESLQREVERLRRALDKYGDHTDECPSWSHKSENAEQCACGYLAALAPPREP
jgi:predicted RNase H-like nuclease (RuvC/YqgF family)